LIIENFFCGGENPAWADLVHVGGVRPCGIGGQGVVPALRILIQNNVDTPAVTFEVGYYSVFKRA
jgi:hypothetical protein